MIEIGNAARLGHLPCAGAAGRESRVLVTPDDTELLIPSQLWKLRLRDVMGPPRGLLGTEPLAKSGGLERPAARRENGRARVSLASRQPLGPPNQAHPGFPWAESSPTDAVSVDEGCESPTGRTGDSAPARPPQALTDGCVTLGGSPHLSGQRVDGVGKHSPQSQPPGSL